METIRTSTKVRVMLTFNFCNFDIETEIKNDNGVTDSEINDERIRVASLVTHAIEDYKAGEKSLKETVPTFDPDKHLDELLAKKERLNSKK